MRRWIVINGTEWVEMCDGRHKEPMMCAMVNSDTLGSTDRDVRR